MSLLVTGEPRQDVIESKGPIRCRIPQRLPVGRLRTQPNKPKPITDFTPRFPVKNPVRPRSDERPSTIPKKIMDHCPPQKSSARPVITVPTANSQRNQLKNVRNDLPDQQTIENQERCEDLNDIDGPTITEKDSLCSRGEKVVKLKKNWQENIAQFDQMKKDLI
ncbi:hypothetical protein HF086_000592 [Spodoptera exigua]|uniref:Uncharacterized protein n=1 Tax=Spodoptera exigua TaxID=7107 RepID=A0A922MQ82_SPOEX|nr:hypothetical protein HF086_000592 [Spodoptera exigua]